MMGSENKLEVSFEANLRDDVGRLWFVVASEEFSGRGFYWSNLTEIPSLVDALKRYPMRETISQQWGHEDCLGDNVILELEIKQVDSAGRLELRLQIADQVDPWQRVRLRLNTEYAALESFANELEVMCSDHCQIAHLQCC